MKDYIKFIDMFTSSEKLHLHGRNGYIVVEMDIYGYNA